ncbi:MAG: type II 3-dehydroquinate dehydratase [Salaquimonas sp.]|jgi:3-dehydroquinate dehydratase-2|nr:type II 3-dehydroquinate dehydratase [Salaquimonas sp.]
MNRLVYVLNGPNLNLLGERQPLIYGSDTLGEVEGRCIETGEKLGLEVHFFQSNAEHELVNLIQEARRTAAGIVINAAAYTHTSVAILDALNACEFPVIEVHISNVHKRESFRHFSYISQRADGIIIGCGTQGYDFALQRLATLLAK